MISKLQSNFYKLNHHYPERKKNFNLQKLPVKEAKADKISFQDAVAVLQLIEKIQATEVQII